MKKVFLIILILIAANYTFAQDRDSELKVIELKGKIFDSETNKPIVFAHVINMKKAIATITDTSGYFRIIMLKTDSIRISSIGYEISYFSLPDTVKSKEQYFNIYLKPVTYDLNQIDIYSERWKAFVYDMSNTKIEEDETQQRIQIWFDNLVPVDELKMLATAARGVGFPLNFKSKRDKQLILVEELMLQSELNKIAEEKFNKELVEKITGLHDEKLDDFMKYCRFDRDFILRKTEYDLIVIVQEIYEIYREEKL